MDREKVIRIIDELIFEAQKEPTWKAENALKCLKKELLKEQEAKIEQLNRFVNGFSRDAIPVVRCKDCKYAHKTYDGDCKYCDMFTDDDGNLIERYRSGDWFCADGERRDDDD